MNYSLEDQLLHSSLLCGMKPGGNVAHRLQLIFVCNKDLESRNRQNDFQRALETATKKSLWENWPDKGSGEYRITQKGYERGLSLFGEVAARYSPAPKSRCNFTLEGHIGNVKVLLRTSGGEADVYLDGRLRDSAKEACRELERMAGIKILTAGGAATRDIYNLAIDKRFEMKWGL